MGLQASIMECPGLCGIPFANFFRARRRLMMRVYGPAQSGKTSIIRFLKDGKHTKVYPTTGMEIELVDFSSYALVFLDSRQTLEGRNGISYSHLDEPEPNAIIFVVDSADAGRLRIAARLLKRVLSDPRRNCALLVLASKQDLPNACSVSFIEEQLGLGMINDRDCGIFSCSALTGEGLHEALAWLCGQVEKRRKQSKTAFCSVSAPARLEEFINEFALPSTVANACLYESQDDEEEHGLVSPDYRDDSSLFVK